MRVGVCVNVGVLVAVSVGVNVGVLVAVNVGVLVNVAVNVGVSVGVDVNVGVNVGVDVKVGVSVGVFVAVNVGVGVGVGQFSLEPPTTWKLPGDPSYNQYRLPDWFLTYAGTSYIVVNVMSVYKIHPALNVVPHVVFAYFVVLHE